MVIRWVGAAGVLAFAYLCLACSEQPRELPEVKWVAIEGYAMATEAQVAAFELELGVAIPAEFRQCLLEHNGALPDPAYYYVNGPDDQFWSDIFRLYGIGKPHHEPYIGDPENDATPNDMLIIGDDGTGGRIGMGLRGDRRDEVYYLDHNYAMNEPQYAVKLADSLVGFLEQLTDAPEDDG